MIKHVKVTIQGKVQGVGFRYHVLETALEFSITGFAKNLGYDSIYLEAEGEVDNLKSFLKICKTGPRGAKITKFDYVSEETLKNFKDFTLPDFEVSLKNDPFYS